MSAIRVQSLSDRRIRIDLEGGVEGKWWELDASESRLLILDGTACYEVTVVSGITENSNSYSFQAQARIHALTPEEIKKFLLSEELTPVYSIVRNNLELEFIGNGLLVFRDTTFDETRFVAGYDAPNLTTIPYAEIRVFTLDKAVQIVQGSWDRTELVDKYAWEASHDTPPTFLIKKVGGVNQVLRWSHTEGVYELV